MDEHKRTTKKNFFLNKEEKEGGKKKDTQLISGNGREIDVDILLD